ncbi:MAG TPA: aminoglycoside/hydroxyurea antibiotic resistance kinase [Ktedonobacter sp.]|nr:aminoglycoside/hydroxyurea antibiotic resistance kinase [Ktedonobacter sp.]
MFIIPDDFVRNVSAFHGDEGRPWIERLRTILANCEQRWGLTFASPFEYQSYAYHYIAPAMRSDGTAVVVKVHAPTGEFIQEAEALRIYDGHGMARLLDYDLNDEVLMLERLEPGTPLSDVEDDDKATSNAAGVMRQLWRPVAPGHPFPSVSDWGLGFLRLRQHYEGGNGPFPAALLEEAETLFAELSTSMTELVLLHGDLHHENILAAEREPWLAIDPKGLIGEPAYETGALLRNRLPDLRDAPQAVRVLTRRVDLLAEMLDLDRGRVRDWAMAQAVLSVWWTIEDKGDIPEDGLKCAELLAAIKR